MELATRLETRQAAVRRADPRLIARNAILELSVTQLQQRIEEELGQNPALEVLEDNGCPVCGMRLEGLACHNCGYRAPDPALEAACADLEPELHFAFTSSREAGERSEDPIAFLEAEFTLREHVAIQARGAAPRRLYPLVEYLINSLDPDGYLECDLVEAAARNGVEVRQMERALAIIQSLDPPGIGARSLQECLLLQLRGLREEGEDEPLAERIIRECWRLLSARAYTRIARRLEVTLAEVEAAVTFIRSRLCPCPGARFRPPWHWKAPSPKAVLRPDLIITAAPASPVGYRVEIPVGREIAINERYLSAYAALSGRTVRDQDSQHVQEAVERARRFLAHLEERKQTIRRITEQVIIRQREFLDTGSQSALVPLTRAEIARITGFDESTVSRATAGKFVLLPNKQLVPYAIFFDASLALKSVIARLVAQEGKDKPLSDRRLAELLAALGYSIARRTVAKYREASGIPMAELRGRKQPA